LIIGQYGNEIPDAKTFTALVRDQGAAMLLDKDLRASALDLQSRAERYAYGYQQTWAGVPIVRLPEDIVRFQEVVWSLRPGFIVETGIARAGSLLLSASLMAMTGDKPHVLGIDIQILEHAKAAIRSAPWASDICVWEGDSAGEAARNVVSNFIRDSVRSGPGILVLDSDHTHHHVLAELRSLAGLLPVGSYILVADTLIEEFEEDHYPNRPWGPGNSPLSALNEFLADDPRFQRVASDVLPALVTEFRDGIVVRRS
jgi:cephalosporin hydroxylase